MRGLRLFDDGATRTTAHDHPRKGDDMAKPARSRSAARSAAVSIAIIVVAAFVAACTTAASQVPSPSAPPSQQPSPLPSGQPSPQPSPDPSDPPVDGYIRLDLDNATDNEVTIAIEDETGKLAKAISGEPGDRMSTRWFESIIESLDDRTIRIVWVGLPMDDEVLLGITRSGGHFELLFVQNAPPANSDALGYDRILVLEFDEPVTAEDFRAVIQEGRDTDD
jgi:hypothetical protein